MLRQRMETTTISPERTAQEIVTLLAHIGARQVVTEYDESGELIGIRWAVERDGVTIPFSLPARIEPVFQHLLRSVSTENREKRQQQVWEQAKRIAWRQLLRWLQAQLAFIQTGMVTTEEVFMPYIELRPNRTMFDALAEQKFKGLLAAGQEGP